VGISDKEIFMNTITLCCTTNAPQENLLLKMLDSAKGFDERIVHLNNNENIRLPEDVKIRTLPQPVSAAWGYNCAIIQASSEWICPMADDDFFHEENLKELLTWFKTADIKEDIIYFPIFCGNEKQGYVEQNLLIPNFELLQQQNMLPFSCFYRKSLWTKVQGYDNLPFNDWGFWLKAFAAGATYYRWEKPIYYFRVGMAERLSDRERKNNEFEQARKLLLNRIGK
jgi:glycosyltransferase involved in cell wall biosynthesis